MYDVWMRDNGICEWTQFLQYFSVLILQHLASAEHASDVPSPHTTVLSLLHNSSTIHPSYSNFYLNTKKFDPDPDASHLNQDRATIQEDENEAIPAQVFVPLQALPMINVKSFSDGETPSHIIYAL